MSDGDVNDTGVARGGAPGAAFATASGGYLAAVPDGELLAIAIALGQQADTHGNHHDGLPLPPPNHPQPLARRPTPLRHRTQDQGRSSLQIKPRHGYLLDQVPHRHRKQHRSRRQGLLRELPRPDKRPPGHRHRGWYQIPPVRNSQRRTLIPFRLQTLSVGLHMAPHRSGPPARMAPPRRQSRKP